MAHITPLALIAVVVAMVVGLPAASPLSITKFGAVANDTSVSTTLANSAAIAATFAAANAGPDKIVEVPAGQTFYVMNASMDGLTGVEFQINGKLVMNNNETAWPVGAKHFAAFTFTNCVGLTVSGNGTVDGQGYNWWWKVLLKHIDHRPDMFVMDHCQDTLITGITARNSPKFHFYLSDMLNLTVRGVTIKVDVVQQQALLEQSGNLHWPQGSSFPIPTFPLNTDGIDPSGKDILIEECYIENFDDAVAVKPINADRGGFSACTENVVVRNTNVAFGVGMSIGSVPPHPGVNCVRNVTFENISYQHPIKAIYIKTDPGTKGTGIIDNITYRNIHAQLPLWYPIWIGPQQQKQPGTTGTGCSFLYPIVKTCPTNPLVPITNVHLTNVTMEQGLTLPGVLLCNATNPCTGFQFDDVTNTGSFLVQKDYVCQNVQGTVSGSNPAPPCF